MTALIVCFLATAASAQSVVHAPTFSVTPNRIQLCGRQETPMTKFDCRVTETASEVLDVEIGKKTPSGDSPIARILHDQRYTLHVVDNRLKGRLTQQDWAAGRLTMNLDRPLKADLGTYYCRVAYISGSLHYGEASVTVGAKDLSGQVPACNENNVVGATRNHASVTNPSGGTCPDGKTGRPEALVLEFCQAPDIAQWTQGQKVMDMCCQIPPYTPVATFVFGVHVVGEQGVAGVFLQCIPGGFSMALQLCGYGARVVNLTRGGGTGAIEDPDHYYVSQFPSHIVG